jgi:hypothetical protein
MKCFLKCAGFFAVATAAAAAALGAVYAYTFALLFAANYLAQMIGGGNIIAFIFMFIGMSATVALIATIADRKKICES